MTDVVAFGRLGIALGAVLTVAACQMGNGAGPFAKPAGAAASSGGTDLITVVGGGDQDVEAPKVFSMTAKALWDGRPSLGGVWVAHTSVKDPERVIIRNPANGKSVIGALFRREIDNPGPSLQLSSDAADALGMLAGQPATISVVALRRAEPAAPPAAAAEVTTETLPATEKTKEAAVKGAKDAKTKTAAATPTAPAATKSQKMDAKALAAAAAAAIDKAQIDKTTAAKAKGLASSAAQPAASATKAARQATAPQAAQVVGVATQRPYVQIGIFSVEANAQKAAAQMTKAGLTAQVKPDQSQGKTFWRVIIGPAGTVAMRDAMSARVKALGYPDSYPVSK